MKCFDYSVFGLLKANTNCLVIAEILWKLMQALLEPIMKVHVYSPNDNVGDVIGDTSVRVRKTRAFAFVGAQRLPPTERQAGASASSFTAVAAARGRIRCPRGPLPAGASGCGGCRHPALPVQRGSVRRNT